MTPMADHRKRAFAPYFRRLADLMALRDWTILVSDDPPSTDGLASVAPTFGRKLATIRLSEPFLAGTPEEQRHVCVHELIHCHLDPAWEIATDAMPGAVEPAFRRMAEYATDGLAEALARHLPLPDAT